RKCNENRDGKTGKDDAPVCKKQRTKKSRRSSNVPGRKRVIFRAETRAAPMNLRFHRRARTRNRAFNYMASHACNRHGYEHRQKNAHPLLAIAYPCDSQKEEAKSNMRGPITKQADVTHEIVHPAVLMLRHEIAYAVVKMK